MSNQINWEEKTTDELADFCAQKQAEIAALTKEQDEAKKVLFARLKQNKQEEITTPFGRFYQTYRTTYVFPEDVVAIKNSLAEAEERAKAEGRVEEKKSFFYKFGAVKLDI